MIGTPMLAARNNWSQFLQQKPLFVAYVQISEFRCPREQNHVPTKVIIPWLYILLTIKVFVRHVVFVDMAPDHDFCVEPQYAFLALGLFWHVGLETNGNFIGFAWQFITVSLCFFQGKPVSVECKRRPWMSCILCRSKGQIPSGTAGTKAYLCDRELPEMKNKRSTSVYHE